MIGLSRPGRFRPGFVADTAAGWAKFWRSVDEKWANVRIQRPYVPFPSDRSTRMESAIVFVTRYGSDVPVSQIINGYLQFMRKQLASWPKGVPPALLLGDVTSLFDLPSRLSSRWFVWETPDRLIGGGLSLALNRQEYRQTLAEGFRAVFYNLAYINMIEFFEHLLPMNTVLQILDPVKAADYERIHPSALRALDQELVAWSRLDQPSALSSNIPVQQNLFEGWQKS